MASRPYRHYRLRMTRGTLKILTTIWALAAIAGLIAALDDPGRVRSWGGLVAAVPLGVLLAVEWRRTGKPGPEGEA